ncbi:hypothetical protein DFH28DRAFT_903058 [Melampsora americana]|nr:hypothetical protein DFH28DRAFT_903058 [Melampsora americana]
MLQNNGNIGNQNAAQNNNRPVQSTTNSNGNTNNNQQGQNQQNNNPNINNNQQNLQNNNGNINNNQQGQNFQNINFNTQNRNPQQNQGVDVINFSNPVQLTGGNSRTVVQYADGLNVDAISSNRHTLNVQLNQRPPSTDFVTALDPSRSPIGGPWVPLNNYSYVMTFENANPDDLVMRLQVPYSQSQLNSRGVSDSNVYLAIYEPMRSGWVIDMDRSENRRQARVTELNAISAPRGEYILLARQTTQSNDESNPFLRFGSSSQNQFNVLPPPQNSIMPPLQIGTWQDGSKVLIRSSGPMQIQMSIANISNQAIPLNFQTPSKYVCVIRADSTQGLSVTHLQMPYIPTQLSQRNIDPSSLVVMGRPIGSQGPYQVLSSTSLTGSSVLMNTPMTMVSGEYLLGAPGQALSRTVSPQTIPVPGALNPQPRPLGPTEALISPTGTAAFAPAPFAAGIGPPPPLAPALQQTPSNQPDLTPEALLMQQLPTPQALVKPAVVSTNRLVDLANPQIPGQTNDALSQNVPGIKNLTPFSPQAFNNGFLTANDRLLSSQLE